MHASRHKPSHRIARRRTYTIYVASPPSWPVICCSVLPISPCTQPIARTKNGAKLCCLTSCPSITCSATTPKLSLHVPSSPVFTCCSSPPRRIPRGGPRLFDCLQCHCASLVSRCLCRCGATHPLLPYAPLSPTCALRPPPAPGSLPLVRSNTPAAVPSARIGRARELAALPPALSLPPASVLRLGSPDPKHNVQ